MKKLTFEEKKARVRDFRPIDDAFFKVLAKDKEINNDKFPKLTQGVNYLKEDEEGVELMCEVIDRERRDAAKKAAQKAKAEERVSTTIEYVNDGDLSPEKAAQKLGMTLEEFMHRYKAQLRL